MLICSDIKHRGKHRRSNPAGCHHVATSATPEPVRREVDPHLRRFVVGCIGLGSRHQQRRVVRCRGRGGCRGGCRGGHPRRRYQGRPVCRHNRMGCRRRNQPGCCRLQRAACVYSRWFVGAIVACRKCAVKKHDHAAVCLRRICCGRCSAGRARRCGCSF